MLPYIDFHGYKIRKNGTIIGKSGKRLKQYTKKSVIKGYLYVSVMVNGKCRQMSVHSLVYTAFNGCVPHGMVIDHIDNNALNNELSNLQVLTTKENTRKDGNIINQDIANRIRIRRAAGERGASLAREYGISDQLVCDIHKGRKWND